MTFERAIREFRSKKILVVGDVMLDRYVRGIIERISPEAPVPIVQVTDTVERLGGAANVAANITALGAKAVLLGVVGSDHAGRTLAINVREAGIGGRLVTDEYRPTTIKTRVVAHNQQICRIDEEHCGEIRPVLAKRIVSHVLNYLDGCDGVIISDYSKGVVCESVLEWTIKAVRSQGKPVCIDPKSMTLDRYRTATCLTPNELELERAAGHPVKGVSDRLRAATQVMQRSGAESILFTRGESGMELYTYELCHSIPAAAKEVYDVTGAGDTVIATLTLGLAAGLLLYEAAQLANLAAGISVGKFGAAQVTPAELCEAVHEMEAAA